ncbi:MAG: hypothetical protein COU10_03405 [Candidatus Harrisonbacteria bacterium CG10_big_fil_rev_8_21_14_0_10_45_28]|uniref:Glycosyl transferase family 1 domain-containing protein n=1 Tax=Candidatus Harrisonbacteria bacterium CG10_big_fil_rev_8_21_14_0_10_45_28 TaxID=1974586 RepID=A0A2H0UMS9_9BACT|nr:MAG: hypothetical protein COU10_03405 [Candidatus Harrisonbacteria bacterium CG10_big_fil_rev_8_21_14_0_10_45_28]
MKILHTVEFYEPCKGGAEEVVKQLSECLVAMGHDVTVATTVDKDRTPGKINGVLVLSFDISGNKVVGFRAGEGEIERYKNLLHEEDFDLILNYAAQSWPTDLMYDELHSIKAKKILVPCGYSGLNDKKYKEYFEKLPDYLARYNSLVYMSENYQDKKFGDEHGFSDKGIVIPNGVSMQEFDNKRTYWHFPGLNKIKTERIAISISNHYKKKGHSFVIKAFKMMGRKDTTLAIIGQLPSGRGLKKIAHIVLDYWHCWLMSILNRRIKLVSGRDREMVLGAYAAADVFLFGSEVECAPLVTYEAMASNVVFITRPVGNVLDHKDYIKIVKTPVQMAQVANDVLDNEEARQMIVAKAREYCEKNHNWAKIVKQYESLYNTVLE